MEKSRRQAPPPVIGLTTATVVERSMRRSLAYGFIAMVALGADSAFGDVRSRHLEPKTVGLASVGVFLAFGVLAVRRTISGLSDVSETRTGRRSGGGVLLLLTAAGYATVLFVVLGMVGVSATHLLVGGTVAGVILGIAAQQTLGNVFAGIVLTLAHPFRVGDRIRVRSGALGGVFEATVLAIGLTFVTVQADDGVYNLPNATLLAGGVGPAPS